MFIRIGVHRVTDRDGSLMQAGEYTNIGALGRCDSGDAMKQATILQFVNDNRLTTSSRARLVSCPACDAEVALSKINAHLDEGCRPTDRWKPSPASEAEVRSGPKRSEEVRRELAATKERPRTSEAEVGSPKRSEEVRRELAAIKERPSTSEGPALAATSLDVQRTEPASEQRSPDWNAASQRKRRRRSRDDGRRSKRKKIEDSERIAGSSDETRRGRAATSDFARRPSGCQGAPPSPRARENADGGFANGRGGASVANGVREEKETRKKRGALSRGVPRRRPADASGGTDAVVAAATDPLRVGVAERNDPYRRRGLVNDRLVKFSEGTGHVPPAASDAKDTPDGASGLDVKDALDGANRLDVKDALDGASGLSAESVSVGEGAPGEREDDAAERVPYYLNNFVFVMKSVLSNAEDRSLLDDADMQVVENFFQLSDAAKQLYVRLFQRKHCWLPVSRLRYPLIAEDLCPVVDELASSGFLLTGDHLKDVRMVLELLSGPDVRSLAKDLRVMGNKSKKSDLTQCVLDYASKQRSIFGKSMHGVVLKKARKMLGACCVVDEKPRVTLLRLLLLFSLTMITLDDEDAGMGQLYSLLMVNMGKISYPSYAISRTAKIFPERDSLIRFQSILCMATELTKHLQNNAFESGLQAYLNAKEQFRESYTNESIIAYDIALPVWLRDFTANSIYTKLLYMGVELLQKMRDYKDVRTGHRLSLYLRAVKICKSLRNKKLEHRMEEVTPVPCQEPPKVPPNYRHYSFSVV
ncbi:PREDICTED: fanconi-associated nuclease 1-like [Priapulus caudatus]|uniref:Fanconi-associated nuclease n=1 Tax=Priapulus caudatus TaxID=37621 RepID=A0ABM1F1S9_PRICU|nr:PREDICTED: fanconi-associated nuclease 1-like [Priapulus caudatus]